MSEDTENQQWKSISNIDKRLEGIGVKIEEGFKRVEQKIDMHIADPVIHTRPPCEHYRVMSKRLWGIVAVALSSLITAIYSMIGKN